MIKSVKRICAAVLSAVMMLTAVATPLGDNLPAVRESTSLTAGAAVSASKWGTAITNKNDSRVSSALNNITSQQKNISSTVQSGKSVKDMIYYLVFESEYAVYGGKTIPNNHCNLDADGGDWLDTFAEETVYGYKINMASKRRGCFWYAGYISNIIYGKDGAGDSNSANIICRNGGLTSSNLKSFIMKYLQAGEHIRMQSSSNSPHSISYISYDANGFYYLDYLGYKNENAGLRYITYDKFVSVVNSYSYKVYVYNANTAENNSSTPTPSQSVTDHYKLTSPDGYQTIRKEASTNSANLGSINAGNIVCVTKYSSDNKWGYLTYNGVSGWIRLYYVEKTGSTHSYGSWYTKTSATCTSGGTEERKCSCGATESRSTSALGHNYGSTYFEADHPHKYAHLCQRCGYKEFTGGNLAIYEKCDICYNENLPGKPYLNISSNGFTESDTVLFTWDPTDKTTHYNLTVEVLSGDEYKTVCRQTYVNSGFQATFGKGQYRAVLDSYNSNMFHQYTSDWRDWVHNSSEYVYFNIDCAHEFLEEVVSPTYDNEGYTLHKCTKCGYSYKDNYTPALKLTELTGVKVKTQGSTSLTLAWDKNASASGYVVEQYKGGKWTQIAKTASNAVVSYTVNGLKADTTYTFRIKGYVVSGTTEYSGEYTRLAAKTRIANVGSFKGSTVSGSAVKLDWSKNDKATGYVIEQYKGGKWTALATTKNNTTLTFTVKGLASATVYSFRIKSFRTVNGKTDYSEYTSLKAATSFGGVNNLTVKSYTASAITLAWNKNVGATGYALEQYKGGKWVQIAKTASNAVVSYTVNGLKADTTYTFRVRAYKTAAGKTIYSEYARLAAKTRIANVGTFKGSTVSDSAVKLDWSKNDKASGYIIEQYKGGKWTALATTKNNTTLTFTVKGLAKGTTYSFRIKSFRKTGSTIEFSEYTAIKAATSFGGVSGLAVKSYTASAITLAWNKNASANGYVVEQYKGGKWIQIAKTSSNAVVSYTVSGLAADTTYTFRVRAYKTAAGKTIYSEYTRLAAKTRIAKVASFRATGTTTSAVELSWNKNDKATGYIIETYRGGKWTAIATTKNNTTLRFTMKGLARNTTYSFRIKAFRTLNGTTEFSEYSSLKAATRK